MVFKHVDDSGMLQERLLGFSDVCSNHSAIAFTEHIIEVGVRLECSFKIDCEMYDWASVMSEGLTLSSKSELIFIVNTFRANTLCPY